MSDNQDKELFTPGCLVRFKRSVSFEEKRFIVTWINYSILTELKVEEACSELTTGKAIVISIDAGHDPRYDTYCKLLLGNNYIIWVPKQVLEVI